MQAATLNSLVRALAPSSAARALRMVSFMTTLGLPTYHLTTTALIGACARQHLSAEASDLYWCACRNICCHCLSIMLVHAGSHRLYSSCPCLPGLSCTCLPASAWMNVKRCHKPCNSFGGWCKDEAHDFSCHHG